MLADTCKNAQEQTIQGHLGFKLPAEQTFKVNVIKSAHYFCFNNDGYLIHILRMFSLESR